MNLRSPLSAPGPLRRGACLLSLAFLSACGVAPQIPGVAGFMKPDAPILPVPAPPAMDPSVHRIRAAAPERPAPDVAQPAGQIIAQGSSVMIIAQVDQATLDGLRVISRLERELIRAGFNIQSGFLNNMQGADGQPMSMDALLREAGSGPVKPDYLYVLTEFDSGIKRRLSGDLSRTPELQELIVQHPHLADSLREQAQFSCEVGGVRASARMIERASGRVVWLGTHSLHTPDLDEAGVGSEWVLRLQPQVTNQNEVDDYYRVANSEEGRTRRTRMPESYPAAPDYQFRAELAGSDWVSGPCLNTALPVNADDARKMAAQLLSELTETIDLSAAAAATAG